MSSINLSKENRNDNNNNSLLSLVEFLKIPVEEIDLNVKKFNSNVFGKTTYEVSLNFEGEISNSLDLLKDYTVQKRYTEFQGFYDSLTYRYQNINFPSFPSKFQILNQKESRRKFFDSLLKTVLKLAVGHKEIRKELMKLLHEFFFRQGGSEVKQTHRKTSIQSSEINSNLENFSMDNADINTSFSFKITDENLQKFNSQDKKTNFQSFLNENAMIANLFHIEKAKEDKTPKSII